MIWHKNGLWLRWFKTPPPILVPCLVVFPPCSVMYLFSLTLSFFFPTENERSSVEGPMSPRCTQWDQRVPISVRVLRCFPDPLITWTFCYSSDSLSTELDVYWITQEICLHTVPSSPLIVQTVTRPTHRRHHTIFKSLNPPTDKNYNTVLGAQIFPFNVNSVDYNKKGLSLSVSSNPKYLVYIQKPRHEVVWTSGPGDSGIHQNPNNYVEKMPWWVTHLLLRDQTHRNRRVGFLEKTITQHQKNLCDIPTRYGAFRTTWGVSGVPYHDPCLGVRMLWIVFVWDFHHDTHSTVNPTFRGRQ